MIGWQEIILRLALASIFGALVGLERERKNWSAGLRTHMMVSVGSCLVMLVSAFGFSDILGTAHVELDPSRIAAQVISGIGFIGAGTIMFLNRRVIRGLTTASGLWTVAAIGLATGGGMYFAAGITTFIALIILWGLQQIEQKYFRKTRHTRLKIIALSQAGGVDFMKELIEKNHLVIQDISLKKEIEKLEYHVKFENIEIEKIKELLRNLRDNPLVVEFQLN